MATASVAGVGAHITVGLRPAVTTAVDKYSFGAVLDSTGITVTERTISLPGGVMVTKRAGGDVWSYPNIHGDVQAVANAAGVKQGATLTYDPYRATVAGSVDNHAGNFDYGWVGQHAKGLDHEPGTAPLIEMGARGYMPSLGRFLQPDPVRGGNLNDYIYPADPINQFDLDGRQAICARMGFEDMASYTTMNYGRSSIGGGWNGMCAPTKASALQAKRLKNSLPRQWTTVVWSHRAGILKTASYVALGAALVATGPVAAAAWGPPAGFCRWQPRHPIRNRVAVREYLWPACSPCLRRRSQPRLVKPDKE